jgi:hypothetical protein
MKDDHSQNIKPQKSSRRQAAIASHDAVPLLVFNVAPEPLQDAGLAARAYGSIAIRALADIAANPDAPATARVAAAGKLLERGFGRVPLERDHSDAKLDLFGLSDDEFENLLQQQGMHDPS